MEQEQALFHCLTSLKFLLLMFGFVLNLCALVVFYDVPKLLKSTINTLVRNLFVVHLSSVLMLGPLVTFDCQAWTQPAPVGESSSSFKGRISPCSPLCILVRFLRATPVTSVFVILWIMALDRTMTIVFPKHQCTLYLKRNPNLVTLIACLLTPMSEAYNFLVLMVEEGSGGCEKLSTRLLRYAPLALQLTQVSALVGVCLVLLAKLKSAPPKYSTDFMKRIVLLVVTLIASYICCTMPLKILQVLPSDLVLLRTLETLVLMPIVVHPISYFLISVNFRKAMRRCLRRRTFVFSSRYNSRNSDNANATLSITAFSITSEETLRHSTPTSKRVKP